MPYVCFELLQPIIRAAIPEIPRETVIIYSEQRINSPAIIQPVTQLPVSPVVIDTIFSSVRMIHLIKKPPYLQQQNQSFRIDYLHDISLGSNHATTNSSNISITSYSGRNDCFFISLLKEIIIITVDAFRKLIIRQSRFQLRYKFENFKKKRKILMKLRQNFLQKCTS